MNKVALTFISGIAAIVAIGIYFNRPQAVNSEAPSRRTSESITKSEAPKSSQSGVVAVSPPAKAAPQAHVSLPRPPAVKSIPLFREFDEASDLKALIDRLGRFPQGADEKAYVARALLACQRVADVGIQRVREEFNSRPRGPDDVNVARRTELFLDRTERCKGFDGTAITYDEIKNLRQAAAKEGSALGIAGSLFEIERSAGRERTLDAVKQVLQSRDPIAMFEVAGTLTQLPLISIEGRSREELSTTLVPAWTLAACDLGMNCGTGSSLLAAHCISMNQCGSESVEASYRRQLPERTYEAVQQLRGVIGTAIARQDWRALGLR